MSTKSVCLLGLHISSQKAAPNTPLRHEDNIRYILEEAQELRIDLDPIPNESFSREEAALFAIKWQEQTYDALCKRAPVENSSSIFMIGIRAGQLSVNCVDSLRGDESALYSSESKTEALRLLNEIEQLCYEIGSTQKTIDELGVIKKNFTKAKTLQDSKKATAAIVVWLFQVYHQPTK